MIAYLVGDRGGELGPERGVAGPARLPGRPPPVPQQIHLQGRWMARGRREVSGVRPGRTRELSVSKTQSAGRERRAPSMGEGGARGTGAGQCVDLVFKLSYGNMLYIGKSGHFTLKWPDFP